jgi:hydrogenase expression/formation protein HypC
MCLGSIGRIVATWDAGGIPMARVDVGAAERPVCLMYVPDAAVDDHVLVHVGYALEVLSEETATTARELRAAAANEI